MSVTLGPVVIVTGVSRGWAWNWPFSLNVAAASLVFHGDFLTTRAGRTYAPRDGFHTLPVTAVPLRLYSWLSLSILCGFIGRRGCVRSKAWLARHRTSTSLSCDQHSWMIRQFIDDSVILERSVRHHRPFAEWSANLCSTSIRYKFHFPALSPPKIHFSWEGHPGTLVCTYLNQVLQ